MGTRVHTFASFRIPKNLYPWFIGGTYINGPTTLTDVRHPFTTSTNTKILLSWQLVATAESLKEISKPSISQPAKKIRRNNFSKHLLEHFRKTEFPPQSRCFLLLNISDWSWLKKPTGKLVDNLLGKMFASRIIKKLEVIIYPLSEPRE